MNAGKLELSDLGRLILAERSRRAMSLREAALAIGIPFNILARVEKGHVPDFLSSNALSSGVAPISSNSLKSRRGQLLPPM